MRSHDVAEEGTVREYDPDDSYDVDEAQRLGVAPWMLDVLGLNPDYVYWGPNEDRMAGKGAFYDSWAEVRDEFGELNELNEVVNFYFRIGRESETCRTCGGTGYHPDAHWVSESFYGHSTPFRAQTRGEREAKAVMDQFGSSRSVAIMPSLDHMLEKYGEEFMLFADEMRATGGEWCNKITQYEADALVSEGRLRIFRDGEWVSEPRLADEINAARHSHDAINRCILIDERLKRFGIPKTCPGCDGHGTVFTAPAPHVVVVLWVIHPRKGGSVGIESRIRQADLPDVFRFLATAAERNAMRFSRVLRGDTP
jgi:hypothetical protein